MLYKDAAAKKQIALRRVQAHERDLAMEMIDEAKRHLKQQGINQWQTGYPDAACIQGDIDNGNGFFVAEEERILGYLCVDFNGEPAYDHLCGQWQSDENYVVMHRMALTEHARGRGICDDIFGLVEEMSKQKGVYAFRVDTDADNKKMQHILTKNGFAYRGTIRFDNSDKIAFDKTLCR